MKAESEAKLKNGKYSIPLRVSRRVDWSTQEELNRVKVKEAGEVIVRIDRKAALGETIAFAHKNKEYWLRESVANALGSAALELSKVRPDLLFCLHDALRSVSKQKAEFELVCQRFKKVNPEASDKEIYQMTTAIIADPRGGLHTGGGAIDLTLISKKGEEIDMGFCNSEKEECMSGCFYDERNRLRSASVSKKAFLNRLLLAEVMVRAGFWCDSGEWWHFNMNNRAVAVMKKTVCPYGDIENVKSFSKARKYSGPRLKTKIPTKLLLKCDPC